MKLFVGIDVSSEKLDVCFLTDDNQLSILSEISVANDIEGASFIRETILEFNNSYHFDQIVIGMESTSMYSFHPSMFFHEDEKLKKLNTLVTIENPFRVKQFSRMFDENKTDRNDRFKQPEKIAKAIQRAITMSYRLGALAQESINVVLSVLVREIRALEKNIKELDKAIEQVIVVIPEYQCLTSIPGVGKVYAAGLIAEIG
ncbi:hypothetical protein EfmJHP9_18600 [Enterococcus faecium]|nr:hypothetical protein EfmJHP9_18600 [Enterococcus faecium]